MSKSDDIDQFDPNTPLSSVESKNVTEESFVDVLHTEKSQNPPTEIGEQETKGIADTPHDPNELLREFGLDVNNLTAGIIERDLDDTTSEAIDVLNDIETETVKTQTENEQNTNDIQELPESALPGEDLKTQQHHNIETKYGEPESEAVIDTPHDPNNLLPDVDLDVNNQTDVTPGTDYNEWAHPEDNNRNPEPSLETYQSMDEQQGSNEITDYLDDHGDLNPNESPVINTLPEITPLTSPAEQQAPSRLEGAPEDGTTSLSDIAALLEEEGNQGGSTPDKEAAKKLAGNIDDGSNHQTLDEHKAKQATRGNYTPTSEDESASSPSSTSVPPGNNINEGAAERPKNVPPDNAKGDNDPANKNKQEDQQATTPAPLPIFIAQQIGSGIISLYQRTFGSETPSQQELNAEATAMDGVANTHENALAGNAVNTTNGHPAFEAGTEYTFQPVMDAKSFEQLHSDAIRQDLIDTTSQTISDSTALLEDTPLGIKLQNLQGMQEDLTSNHSKLALAANSNDPNLIQLRENIDTTLNDMQSLSDTLTDEVLNGENTDNFFEKFEDLLSDVTKTLDNFENVDELSDLAEKAQAIAQQLSNFMKNLPGMR